MKNILLNKLRKYQQNVNGRKLTLLSIFIFSFYFAIGLLIVEDYGTNTNATTEYTSSVINYVYVLGEHMRSSKSEGVRNTANGAPYLMTYRDRFYGVAQQ